MTEPISPLRIHRRTKLSQREDSVSSQSFVSSAQSGRCSASESSCTSSASDASCRTRHSSDGRAIRPLPPVPVVSRPASSHYSSCPLSADAVAPTSVSHSFSRQRSQCLSVRGPRCRSTSSQCPRSSSSSPKAAHRSIRPLPTLPGPVLPTIAVVPPIPAPDCLSSAPGSASSCPSTPSFDSSLDTPSSASSEPDFPESPVVSKPALPALVIRGEPVKSGNHLSAVSSCESLMESPLSASIPQAPSPATARRKRMSKLRRRFGERPPSFLVSHPVRAVSRRSTKCSPVDLSGKIIVSPNHRSYAESECGIVEVEGDDSLVTRLTVQDLVGVCENSDDEDGWSDLDDPEDFAIMLACRAHLVGADAKVVTSVPGFTNRWTVQRKGSERSVDYPQVVSALRDL
ncbi:hypothetical protein FISHEDRAFT_72420 [Fistulina hepatica ATCC 64428]|uniref:Uncharacterized protein n=1 Tax=Fistulina hepatica ATCC 64428 TaxID=1128425 RepID=A0A0D7AEK5_9AGAR|nr:hypothetical protein FISHEDRAFT_72420 [Fistulina hepatica ATCC 64428]